MEKSDVIAAVCGALSDGATTNAGTILREHYPTVAPLSGMILTSPEIVNLSFDLAFGYLALLFVGGTMKAFD